MRAMPPRIPPRLLVALPLLTLTAVLVTAVAQAQAPIVTISPRSETLTSNQVSVTIHWCGPEGYDPSTRSIKVNGVERVDDFFTTSDDPTCGPDASAEVSTGTLTLVVGSNTVYATIYNGGYEGADQVTYTYSPPYKVAVAVAGSNIAEDGLPGNQQFTITNTGSVWESYNLTVPTCSGSVSGCHPAVNSVALSAGADTTINVSYQAGVSGTGQIKLVATDPSHPTSTASATSTVYVNSHTVVVTADAATAIAGIGDPDSLSFKVHNTGDQSALYTLDWSCSGAAQCTVPSTNLSVNPNETKTVWVHYSASGEGTQGTVQLTATYTVFSSIHSSAATTVTAQMGCNSSITVGTPPI